MLSVRNKALAYVPYSYFIIILNVFTLFSDMRFEIKFINKPHAIKNTSCYSSLKLQTYFLLLKLITKIINPVCPSVLNLFGL